MADYYFVVSKYPEENNPTDIAFTPVNKKPIPKDYLKFKSDVESFISTIKVLFSRDKAIQLQFFNEVYFATELCFSGEKDDFITANQTLIEIKDKLTSTYWTKARNEILVKYGIAALLVSFLLFCGYYIFDSNFKYYFISLMGTCLGSWLSLAIRIKQLDFDDIRQQISEVSSPYIRCIFACGLSFSFLMLLKVGVIEVKLGGISSKDLSGSLDLAISLGVLFGFGEKYLVSTINEKSKKMFK